MDTGRRIGPTAPRDEARRLGALLALAGGLAAACAGVGAGSQGATTMAFSLTSPSFPPSGSIPALHTCEGRDVAPALAWADLPAGTRSMVLIVDDPDAPDPRAPRRTWVHWVLYNIPPSAGGLPEGADRATLPAGTLEGRNDFGRTGWGGPCPPIGRHRYFFKAYALDAPLPDLRSPTKAQVERAMEGHVLGRAELVGTYEKGR